MLVIFYLLFLYSILLLLLSEVGFFNDLNDREIFNVMMTRCQKCGIIIPRNRRENWRSESRKKEDEKKEKEKGTRTWKKVFRYFCYSTRKQHRVFFLILFMPLNCIHFTKFIVLISIAFRFARSSIIFLANICTVSIH